MGSYEPSQNEKTIFFVMENGLRSIRRAIMDSNDFYAREAESHAEDSIYTVLVTAVISIASIIAIGITMIPYLSQIEGRRFEAMQYFIKLPREKVEELINNSEYCIGMSEQKRYAEVLDDYERFLGIKLTEKKNRINNQLQHLDSSSSESMVNIQFNVTTDSRKGGVLKGNNRATFRVD